MRLITHIRRVGSSIDVQFMIPVRGTKPIVRINNKGVVHDFRLAKYESIVDEDYCTINHQMKQGALVLVANTSGKVYLMFRICHKRNIPTYYHVSADAKLVLRCARQFYHETLDGFLIGNILPGNCIPRSLGVLYDIDIQRFNAELYTTRLSELLVQNRAVDFDSLLLEIGHNPYTMNLTGKLDVDWRRCLYIANGSAYWLDFNKRVAYNITDKFYRQDVFERVDKSDIQFIAEQFNFTKGGFKFPPPKPEPKNIPVIEEPPESVEPPPVVERIPFEIPDNYISTFEPEPGTYPTIKAYEGIPVKRPEVNIAPSAGSFYKFLTIAIIIGAIITIGYVTL